MRCLRHAVPFAFGFFSISIFTHTQRSSGRLVRLLGADALASLLARLLPDLAGDASFFIRLGLQILQRIDVLMVSPALAEAGAKMLGLSLFADPQEAVAAVERRLGPGPKRVVVFPAGGITYPILHRPLPGG